MFNNAFQNVSCFRDIQGQQFIVLAPKIPYYVTKDPDRGTWDWDQLVKQFCFYNLLQNNDRLKDKFKKLQTLSDP